MTNLSIVLHMHTLLSCFFSLYACGETGKQCESAIATVNVNDFLILYSGLFTTSFVTSCQWRK